MRRTLHGGFGFRPDLDLDQRWWHRLAKVAFTLVLLVATVTVVLLAFSENPGANSGNARVIIDVVTFTDDNRDSKNTLPAFFALEGRLGRLMSDGGIYQYYSTNFLDKSECRYVDPAKQSDAKNYIDVPLDSDFELIGQTVPNEPGDEILDGYCMFQVGVDIPYGHDLVKWEYRPILYAQLISIGLSFLALGAVLTMNLYYRGLVYVICGPAGSPNSGKPE